MPIHFKTPKFLTSPTSRLRVLVGAVALVIAGAVIISATTGAATLQPAGQKFGWELAFNDDFNGTTLDPAKWTTCYPWGTETGCYHGSNELNWYQPKNVAVSGGQLHLTAKREHVAGDGRGYDYTSGMVTSYGKFDFRYGYAEMRAKLTKGQGMWPAFWLLPNDGSWPPEIDVMEQLGHDPKRIYQTYHWGTVAQHQKDESSYSGPNYANGFHTFGVDWSPEAIVYYIDGIERHRLTDKAIITALPQYLLANLAVGGDWPGAPSASTTFPQSMDIDYIRVWRHGPNVAVRSLTTSTDTKGSTVFKTTLQTTKPLTADTLVVGVRDQSGNHVDSSTMSSVKLDGVQTFTFRRVYTPGSYSYWVAYLKDGVWIELGPRQTFAVPSK